MTTRITQTARLDRIEDKIDKMSEAIVTLARVEEKISDLEIRREEQHVRLNRLSEKIDNIDSHVTSLVENVSFMKKLVWFFFATIATLTLSIIVS
jgi:chromosome segregation ATPase